MQEIKNQRYTVRMQDDDKGCQWVHIHDLDGNEIVMLYTTGTVRVYGKDIEKPEVCSKCGRRLQ